MKSRQRWYQRHQLFNQTIQPSLMPWLFDASSLTARLIDLCDNDFNVRVISQHWQTIDNEEAAAMSLEDERSALVRQVFLCCGDRPLVYARTIIPRLTAQGARRRYANMGNRPLGAMLFSDRTMQREDVQVAELPASHEANKYIESDGPLWGRRSVFRVSGKPLMVCEYFLPALLERAGR